ncbi:hypothetical protein PHYPO_G00087460 [Pangasianodon hypophthalmus]|uniref:Uncharacterized protein n=1 Tax=Pangasianodon hypophthalmus TaxID=310915 RepID=A0A5N5LHB9_PANHP|nr:hypothetical protein PHYPO_G00087460 [Pangasianodon hypophthalmus]
MMNCRFRCYDHFCNALTIGAPAQHGAASCVVTSRAISGSSSGGGERLRDRDRDTELVLVLGTTRREVMPLFKPFRKKPMTKVTKQHP